MKKNAAEERYIIYSRKSKFTGKGESIENQIEMCRQYLISHFGQAAVHEVLVFEDEGFSGGNLERPQFKKMMEATHKYRVKAIVVYRLDRISRNIADFSKMIEDLGQRNIGFISIRESFDTGSPTGRAMMYMASVFSQMERETIAERIKDNMQELAKTGRWLGGTTPTGYRSEGVTTVTVDGKARKAYHLQAIPEEQNLVQLIFDKFLETGSLTKVDQFLLEGHYTTKRGKNFTRFAIKGILNNPVYMMADEAAYTYLTENKVILCADKTAFDGRSGIMAYNRTHQVPGKAMDYRPMEEWIVAVGKHPGLIPGATWVQVQNMLSGNRNKCYRHPRTNVALLSGLLICGECGDYMRPKLSTRTTPEGERIFTYMCNTKERSKKTRCAGKNIRGDLLDARILREIKKLAEDRALFVKLLGQSRKIISMGKAGYEAEAESLQVQLSETGAGIKALLKTLKGVAGTSTERIITDEIQALDQEREALQRRMAELESLINQQRMATQEFEYTRQLLSSFANVVDRCNAEEKRRLLRAIIRKIVWDGENIHVYLFAADGEVDFSDLEEDSMPLGEDSE